MSDMFTKTAAALGFNEEKVAHSMAMLEQILDYDAGQKGAIDQMSDETFGKLATSFIEFQKIAEDRGINLTEMTLDQANNEFYAFVKRAEDEKKDEKKDDDEKEEEKKASLALSYMNKVAAVKQAEETYAHYGRVAAESFIQHLEKMANDEEGASHSAAAEAGEKAKGFTGRVKETAGKAWTGAKDLASKGKTTLTDAVKNNPRAAKGVGIGAGVAAVGGGAYAAHRHLSKKNSDGPASEEKKAFDLKAAERALDIVKAAAQNGANVDPHRALNELNEVLAKEAMDGGNDVSDDVKVATDQGAQAMIDVRALELLDQAGYRFQLRA